MKLKKPFTYLLSMLCAFSLASCGGEASVEQVHLLKGDYDASDFVTIEYAALAELVANKNNFIVTTYSSGCICWSGFEPIGKNYITSNNLIFYRINILQFYNNDGSLIEGRETFNLNMTKSNSPLMAIFEGGKVKYQENYTSTSVKNLFTSYDVLKDYLDKRITKPLMLEVTLDQLDSFYKEINPFIIYFGQGTCPDCNYLENNYLTTYNNEHDISKQILYLNCGVVGIRYNEQGETDATQWQAFKDKYGLSATNNTTYGYATGFVPTIQYVRPSGSVSCSAIKSQAVFVNDSLEKDGDNFKVARSYYTESIYNLYSSTYLSLLKDGETSVIQGLEVPSKDVTVYESYAYYAWNHSAAEVYYNPMIRCFLDYYLPLV